jgi:integrase
MTSIKTKRRTIVANGEGYLRQRSIGSWTFTIYLGKDANGKPIQMTKTVRGSKAEAQAEMARLVLERDQGVDLRPEVVTFVELANRWLESKSGDLAPVTFSTYRTLLSVHLLPVLGRMKVRDVRPLHVESVKAAVVNQGRTRKSALNVFRLLDAILSQAVRWQLLLRNPCDAVEAPRPKRFVPHLPTHEELTAILAAADETQYGVITRLAVLTGARQGELLALRWTHVNREETLLTIPGTKTKGSARVIDFGGEVFSLLRRHRAAEREKALKLGPGAICGQDHAPIFTNQVGNPMDAGGLKRTWKRILNQAGVEHVRFHDLRHISATYMLSGGLALPAISQRLGHTRTSTTTDIYGHVLPGMGREAALLLESLMVNGWSKTKEA